MGLHIARYLHKNAPRWAVVHDGCLYPVEGAFTTLREFLEEGQESAFRIAKDLRSESIPINDVELLSPVTAPCKILCQGLNYGGHRAESGAGAKKPPFNLVFSKADSALSGPHDSIVRPEDVSLLDYELELGVIVGKSITEKTTITNDNLHEYVAGIVITNDVSARDIQIPQQQWFKGKSYRTFCPTGPYLYLLEADDIPRLIDLELRLEVNGEVRQEANTQQLLYGPAETLAEVSGIMDLHPGDLLQTGTPGGVALQAPPAAVQRLARIFLSEEKLMQVFVKKQGKIPQYLRDGDVIRCTIRSADGAIDLGVMETTVVGGDKTF